MRMVGKEPPATEITPGGALPAAAGVHPQRGAVHRDQRGRRREPALADARRSRGAEEDGRRRAGRPPTSRSPGADDFAPTSRRRRTATSRPTTTSTSSALDKSDPAENAGTLRTAAVDGRDRGRGRAGRRSIDIDQLLGWFPLEERIYRMRCVEAWSMVIPWVGFPLGELLEAGRADVAREVRRLHDAARPASRCRGSAATSSTGRTSRACASTRRCIRSRSSPTGLYGKTLPQPERRAAAPGRAVEVRLQGHQVDREDPSRPRRSRRRPGTSRRRTSTASTPT